LPDLHTVWEKIPYSFVVDWFVNTEKILSKIDVFGGSGLLSIEEVDECLAIKMSKRYVQNFFAPCLALSLQRVDEKSTYERMVGIGQLDSHLQYLKLPTFQQFLTGLALGTLVLTR
jgi:hypothetical protein